MKYTTKLEACKEWVNEFNAIPSSMVTVLMDGHFEEWEITGELDACDQEETGEEYGTVDFPIWGTLWMFDDYSDEQWADANREKLMDCGFTIVENYEEGWFLIGIDGAGYNFYEHHWLPLYDARGLKWHKEDAA